MIKYKNILFAFTLCFIQIISAEHYHFARRIKTTDDGNMDLYTFENVFGIGIGECVQRCKTKKRCKYINYRVRINGCFLIGFVNNQQASFENVLDKEADCIFANMSDWNTGDDSSCDHCIDDGCPFPDEKKNAKFHGNMFTVGSKGVYLCKAGYAMNTTEISRTKCDNDGSWITTHFKCLPEIVFTEDVLMFNGTYYKLVRVAMNWTNSKQNCEEHGGYLADILSQQEQDIIAKLATSMVSSVWIGGKGRYSAQQYSWLDGTPINSGYSNWYQNQPYHPHSPEACICLSKNWNYSWDDTYCSSMLGSICEING